ncbi:MAG: ABC transporter substrate-binding protein [Myxococcota bacterium]
MKANLLNAVSVATCLGLSSLGATMAGGVWRAPSPEFETEDARSSAKSDLAVLTDARGRQVDASTYQRIVSLNTVADHILLALVEPERLVGVTQYTVETNPLGYRFGQATTLAQSKDVEAVLALRPDLVVISKFAGEDYMARLRERGVAVFDLGEMRGVVDTVGDIEVLGQLLKEPARAERLRNDYLRNLSALESAVSDRDRPRGIYLSVLGDSLFGGTVGSSYADLLHYGGIRDLAAERGFEGWPRYSPEQLLALDPPVIVTGLGRRKAICRHALLGRLSACGKEGRVVEMPNKNHSDPGLGLVHAAQDLQLQVHGIKPQLSHEIKRNEDAKTGE